MYKPISKDEVLRLVRQKGPVIPIHLRKDLNTDTILIGAVLSQLVAEGKVLVSKVKIGGSPTYYVPESEAKLVDLMKYLNEKDRRAAELLREKKIIKDSDQDPLTRVCLRNIKDYAKPLEVNIKGRKDIYWKWYLLKTSDAEAMLIKELKPQKEKLVVKEEEAPAKRVETAPESQKIEVQEEKQPEAEKQKEESKEEKKTPKEESKEKEIKKKEQPQTKKEEKAEKPKHVKHEEIQKVLAKPKILLDEEKDSFFNQVRSYLEESEVAIKDYNIIKKAEIDLFILVPTKLGVQEYFCKAKNKKRISEGDLSSAYLQGQGTKLPIVFLSPGELNKKTKEMLQKEFKGMVVKQI
jgi:hypothetical protein